ncbi:MAG: hypothetical protein J6Y43_07885 [Clostridia bacterium]|nr:hypothetical protein [Clostridia bacterium]
MKKIIICNIPMRSDGTKCVYKSQDLSLPTVNVPVYYPINALLGKTISKGDDIKVVLLVKNDSQSQGKKNATAFIEELLNINNIEAKIDYKIIETDFSEEQSVHEHLLAKIVDEIEDNSRIMCDITYGPKDLPIVLFSALNFAEKYLHCEIDNIIYGQAVFVNGKPTDTKLCDMSPLYYLNSVTNTIRCNDSQKAREMLKTLLSL